MNKDKPLERKHLASLKDNRYFTLSFPFLILIGVFVLFVILTKGRFFRKSVLLGILSQTVIIGACATGISFKAIPHRKKKTKPNCDIIEVWINR